MMKVLIELAAGEPQTDTRLAALLASAGRLTGRPHIHSAGAGAAADPGWPPKTWHQPQSGSLCFRIKQSKVKSCPSQTQTRIENSLFGQDAAHLLENFLRLFELISARRGCCDALVSCHCSWLAHVGDETCTSGAQLAG